jgi:hypothetical protein
MKGIGLFMLGLGLLFIFGGVWGWFSSYPPYKQAFMYIGGAITIAGGIIAAFGARGK